jgi:predicted esterase
MIKLPFPFHPTFRCVIKVLCTLNISIIAATAQLLPEVPIGAPTPAVPQAPTTFTPDTTQTPELSQLRAQLETLEKQLQNGTLPIDPQNLALTRFKLEQSRLILFYLDNGFAPSSSSAQNTMSAYLQRAQVVGQTRGDAADVPQYPMHERAYIAPNDGSTQPYWIFLPPNYSPRQKYPLVMFLHGYSPYVTKVDPWLPDDQTWKLATERGFIFAVPYGRRNSDFVDIGEDDTLKVLSEVQKRYSVDTSRSFLMGPSMGGFGVYAVGLHRPDLWAGLAPMAARSDMYLWFKLQRENVPLWKRLQYDADDPRTLKRNGGHLPTLIQHGALDDIVAVEHSRRMATDLKTLKLPVQYREIEDGDHYIYFGASAYVTALEWMKKLPRTIVPRHITYTSGNPRNAHSYWTEITARDDYSRLATIDAEISGNQIVVKTENVAAFRLTPPAELLRTRRRVTLIVNNTTQSTFDAAKPMEWRSPSLSEIATTTYPGVKTPTRSGPIKNCYRDPFLLVYGTQELADRINNDREKAQLWGQEWEAYADGMPPMKADTQLTTADRANYNLVLFGTRQSNRVLAEIADKLPLELTPDGYRRGTQNVVAQNIGLQMCYPSPFNNARMIVVQSGIAWGAKLPVNHKFDLLPDYIIFDSTIDATDQTNQALRAGYFNHQWQLPKNDIAAPVQPVANTLTTP